MAKQQDSHRLYEHVVRVTVVYLGPAANRFITRQLQNHLNKSPEELTKQDLAKLIDWIQVAVSIITEDKEIVEEYIAQLHKLADPKSPTKRTRSRGGARG